MSDTTRRTSLRCGSLFSGIGGLDLGFERAGMEIAWQVEVDEFCRRVLSKHWPDVLRYGDVFDVDWGAVPKVDVLVAGMPCQPFSIAGLKKGQDDERYLWNEVICAMVATRPQFVVLENVAGLRYRNSGALHTILGDLARLGFDAEWGSIRASDFGAPHQRERIFVVAYPESAGREALLSDGLRAWEAEGEGPSPRPAGPFGFGAWATEPDVGRVADGVPNRVDRLRGLGNAVVPQIAEWLGRIISTTDQPLHAPEDR